MRHHMQSLTCVDYDGYGQLQGQWDTGRRRWAIPVTVAHLERPTRQEMEPLLPAPAVQTVPADGVPSAVHVPMFVATDAASWVSPSLSAFDPLAPSTAVTVTANPLAMTFVPGDDSQAQVCAGPGVLFDRSLVPDDPWVQAGWPGRCSHTYERRTWDTDGNVVPGRPWGWPASLTITWDVTATSGTSVQELRSTGFARPVVEIQTVIVNGGF